MAYARESSFGDTESETDLGNILLGVRSVQNLRDVRVGASLAVALPSSPDTSFLDSNGMATMLSGAARFDLCGHYFPDNTTTWYADVHVRTDGPRYLVQGELGYQRSSFSEGDDALDLLHASVAGGFKATDKMTFIGELTNVSLHAEDATVTSSGGRLLHWLRLGVRHDVGWSTLGGHVYMTLDGPYGDEIDIWGAIFGVTRRF